MLSSFQWLAPVLVSTRNGCIAHLAVIVGSHKRARASLTLAWEQEHGPAALLHKSRPSSVMYRPIGSCKHQHARGTPKAQGHAPLPCAVPGLPRGDLRRPDDRSLNPPPPPVRAVASRFQYSSALLRRAAQTPHRTPGARRDPLARATPAPQNWLLLLLAAFKIFFGDSLID